VPVGVVHLPRLGGTARLQQLVPHGHDHHPGLRVHADARPAHRGEQRLLAGPHPLPRGEHHVATPHVDGAGPHVLPDDDGAQHRHHGQPLVRGLQWHDGVGPHREGCTGGEAHGGAVDEVDEVRVARPELVHHPQPHRAAVRRRDVPAAHRVPVEGGEVGDREVGRRPDVLGEDAPHGVGELDGERGELTDRGEARLQVVVDGTHDRKAIAAPLPRPAWRRSRPRRKKMPLSGAPETLMNMREPLRLPQTVGYETEDAKHELRQVIRKHRHMRSRAELGALGEALAENAVQAVGDARSVALYVSTGWEPPTLPLLERLRARDVAVLLPSLGPGLSRTWSFYKGAEDLQPRAPGRPPEPSGPVLEAEAIRSVEAVITPALAIDGFGNRLGQGGGWYDRVLKLLGPDTPVFTMVFDDELISGQELPSDDHDVRIPAVITPTRVFLIAGSPFERATVAATHRG